MKSDLDYFLDGGTSGLIQTTLSLYATWMGAVTFLAYSTFVAGYKVYGSLYLLLPSVFLIAVGLFFVDRIRELDGATIVDSMNGRFSKWIVALFLVIFQVFMVAAQSSGFSLLVEDIGLSKGVSISVFLLITLLYVGRLGFKGVKITDVFQAVFIGVIVLVLIWFTMVGDSVFQFEIGVLSNQSKSFVMLCFLLGGIMFVSQENHQRIKAAKSASVAKTSCILAGVLVFLTGLALAYIAFCYSNESSNPVLYLISTIPEHIRYLIMFGILCSALSTADTSLSIAAFLGHSGVFKFGQYSRDFWHVLICVTSGFLAFYGGSLSTIILVMINGYAGIFLVPILLRMFKVSKKYGISLFIVGCLTLVGGYLASISHPGIIAFSVSLILALILPRN